MLCISATEMPAPVQKHLFHRTEVSFHGTIKTLPADGYGFTGHSTLYDKGGACIRRRSIFGTVVLSIITCGIYYLTVRVQVSNDISYGVREGDTAIIDLLLSFVTCGIWDMFCFWKYSKRLYTIEAGDNSLINVLFAVFSLPIISFCIMQSSISDLINRTY